MSKLDKVVEKIRDSEAYQQIRGKYDELDSQTKLYVNLGAVAGTVLFVFLTLVVSMAKLNGLKNDINEREELIGYLQRSSDQIKQLKAQQASTRGLDTSSPLSQFVSNVATSNRIDPSKVEVSSERPGVAPDKDTLETLLDIKLNQVNLRQITQFLFALTDQGSARGLNIKDLTVDTKGDPSGWMDANLTVAAYKAK